MVPSFQNRSYAGRRFAEIVTFAREHNPFYAEWITDPENPPILDRATALANNDRILGGHEATGMTSGSTGVPVRYAKSPEWNAIMRKALVRFVQTLGGPVPTAHLVHFEGTARSDTFDVGRPPDEQIDFALQRRREAGASAVTTYPSNAELLCREVIDSGVDMSFVTRFGMYAEAVEPYHRSLVAQTFPMARIWTTYSAKEVGLIAWMCPFEPDFHHISVQRLGVEILKDDDTPAEVGERGRVVVTDYFNRCSPFIRYEIGDLAIPGICPCGRYREPAFARVLGKVIGTILHRNGNRIIFSELSAALGGMSGMRQYQVIQESVEEITVKVVASAPVTAQVESAFMKCFGYVPMNLVVRQAASIPRGANGKTYWCYSNA